jgi:predicted DNA-binding protein YlxM (UPF0122 family)
MSRNIESEIKDIEAEIELHKKQIKFLSSTVEELTLLKNKEKRNDALFKHYVRAKVYFDGCSLVDAARIFNVSTATMRSSIKRCCLFANRKEALRLGADSPPSILRKHKHKFHF